VLKNSPKPALAEWFTLAWEKQPCAVVLQRAVPVSVPCGFRQALGICRKGSLLWAWRGLFANETIRHEIVRL
jgi:hypothetical protein